MTKKNSTLFSPPPPSLSKKKQKKHPSDPDPALRRPRDDGNHHRAPPARARLEAGAGAQAPRRAGARRRRFRYFADARGHEQDASGRRDGGRDAEDVADRQRRVQVRAEGPGGPEREGGEVPRPERVSVLIFFRGSTSRVACFRRQKKKKTHFFDNNTKLPNNNTKLYPSWRLLLMISSTTRESVVPSGEGSEADFAEFDPERWLSPSTAPSSSASAPGGGGSSGSSSSSFYAPFGAVSFFLLLISSFFSPKESNAPKERAREQWGEREGGKREEKRFQLSFLFLLFLSLSHSPQPFLTQPFLPP